MATLPIPIVLIAALVLGAMLLPFLIRLLQRLVPIVRTRCQGAIPWLTETVRRTWRAAWSLVSKQGTLIPAQAIAQQGGAVIIMLAAVVFGASDLLMTYATLGPLLGLQVDLTSGPFASLDRLTALCVVALPIVFGFFITDMLRWTTVTGLAFIERGRVGVLVFAALNFLASIAVAIALGIYRGLVMQEGEGVLQIPVWMLTVPAGIMLPLAALLLIGLAFALTSVEAFMSGVLALLAAIAGVGLSVVLGLVMLVDFAAELAVESLATLPTRRAAPGALQARLARARESLRTARTSFFGRLNRLVGAHAEAPTRASEATRTASGAAASAAMPAQPTAAPVHQNARSARTDEAGSHTRQS